MKWKKLDETIWTCPYMDARLFRVVDFLIIFIKFKL